MISMTSQQWTWVGVLLLCYLAACLHTAFRMAKTGRNFWLWLAVSVFLTSIPATLMLIYDQYRRSFPKIAPKPDRPRRGRGPSTKPCRHCGHSIAPGEVDRIGGVSECPNCHLPIDRDPVA